jgi:hypothetical protein
MNIANLTQTTNYKIFSYSISSTLIYTFRKPDLNKTQPRKIPVQGTVIISYLMNVSSQASGKIFRTPKS